MDAGKIEPGMRCSLGWERSWPIPGNSKTGAGGPDYRWFFCNWKQSGLTSTFLPFIGPGSVAEV